MSVKIRPYKNGGWEVDVRVEAPNGEVMRKRVKSPMPNKGKTKVWAAKLEWELVNEILSPKPITTNKEVPRLKEFKERFLQSQEANRLKKSTLESQETIFRVHLEPVLGELRLDEIGAAEVDLLKAARAKLEAKTVNNILSVLRRALGKAEDWGLIDRIPRFALVKVDESSREFFEFEELERLVDAARAIGSQTLVIVLLGARAGLRLGELLALRWTDVNLQQQPRLTVRTSMVRGVEGSTKGRRQRRVPMGAELVAALKAHRRGDSEWVLCQPDGTALTKKRVHDMMAKALRRAKLPCGETGRVHVLRHTFCTHLALKGVSVRTIQEWAGHKDLKTTMIYMHHSELASDHLIDVLEGKTVLEGEHAPQRKQPTTTEFGDIVETG